MISFRNILNFLLKKMMHAIQLQLQLQLQLELETETNQTKKHKNYVIKMEVLQ